MSSDEDISAEPRQLQAYMYEPLAAAVGPSNAAADRSDDSSDGDEEPDSVDIHLDTQSPCTGSWCSCGNCEAMATAQENVCCRSFSQIRNMLKLHGNRTCVCQLEVFRDNCLNGGVLETSLHEYIEVNGPFGDEHQLNDIYRFLAYRRLCYTIWHRLGHRVRRVLPSCAVVAIRKTFPSADGQYTGFKEI